MALSPVLIHSVLTTREHFYCLMITLAKIHAECKHVCHTVITKLTRRIMSAV